MITGTYIKAYITHLDKLHASVRHNRYHKQRQAQSDYDLDMWRFKKLGYIPTEEEMAATLKDALERC